jgi:hypothetical protein
MTDVDYDAIDPGIREVVRALNDHGFETTDSGDGVTKEPDPGEVMPFPHVAVHSTAETMISDSRRLFALSRGELRGVLGGVKIEATFDPADGHAIILAYWLPALTVVT